MENDDNIRLPRFQCLDVAELTEPRANDLQVIVLEHRLEDGGSRPGRAFQVYWTRYVAYAVRNESYFSQEGDETLGYGLHRRGPSAFRAYVAATTFATDDFPGELHHWTLYAADHGLDVIGPDEPEVSEIVGDARQKLLQRLGYDDTSL